ncbi:MAG: sulfite exporter TauE/SafE family protein [Flavipsychrobacter sp.]|nr:sulfite exporter TauE/SafE family protein [Flavipsychrobacter sp.]
MIPVAAMAFLMGLTGSLHCAGMCGPIMLFMPFHHFSGFRKAAAIALYHLARISVYASMALIVYSFREAFNPKIQQFISITLGSLFLVAGILSFVPVNRKINIKLPWAEFAKRQLSHFIGNPTFSSIAISGVLNGMLPCGLVYMMLSAILVLHSPLQAISFAYFFGAGTLPMLISIILFRSRINLGRDARIKALTPIIVFSFGCLFLLRGLNLGIPYLSPKVTITNGQMHSCCHKK